MTLSAHESQHIDALILWLSKLTAGDREGVFTRLRGSFCLDCGSATPRCYCQQENEP